MAVVEVSHLKYRYPTAETLALDDISFRIEPGERIGIIGANEAGKSTLCQALVGIVPLFFQGAYGGSVMIDGVKISQAPIADTVRKAGLVFQNPFSQVTGAKQTVWEEVAFGLENYGVPRPEMIRRVDDALERLGIEHLRQRNPFSLSGGQTQRMAIAGVLAMQAEIIVMDEPTSQLDPQGSQEVFRAVEALAKEGVSVVLAEHKMEKMAEYCDKIVLLEKGKLVAFDTPRRIFSRDDLAERGVSAPAVTQLCRELNIRDKEGCYPTKFTEIAQLAGDIIKGVPHEN